MPGAPAGGRLPGATQAANAIDRDFVVGDEPLLSFVAWKQFPPPRRQVPVLRVAEPHLGLHALGVPIAPLGHRERRCTIDEQARLGADVLQVGVVIREELRPALQVDLAAQKVALVGVAAFVGQDEVVRQVARVA